MHLYYPTKTHIKKKYCVFFSGWVTIHTLHLPSQYKCLIYILINAAFYPDSTKTVLCANFDGSNRTVVYSATRTIRNLDIHDGTMYLAYNGYHRYTVVLKSYTKIKNNYSLTVCKLLYYSDPGSKYEYSILLPLIVDPHLLKYTVLTSIINAILMHLCRAVRMVLALNLPVLFNLVDIIASMSKYLPKHLPSQIVTIPIGTGEVIHFLPLSLSLMISNLVIFLKIMFT